MIKVVSIVNWALIWTFLVTYSSARNRTDILADLLRNYDRGNVPGRPTIVLLGIYINSIDSINEQTMDYAMSIYLRQEWYDHRLKFTPYPGENISKLSTEMGSWDKVWVPDVFFRNEKRASFHFVTIPNKLLWIYSDGRIYYAQKLSLTLACPMDLRKYPLDSQVCPMQFESFAHTMDYLVYKWRGTPVQMEDTLEMPQFELKQVELIDCSQNYSSGAFPCLQVNFHLKRDIGYFMIQIYLPSGLIVILSWVGFWISQDAVPARITIGLLTALSVTTQMTGSRANLPRVSYIKAIDVWMSACMLFVFASVVEFAMVNVHARKLTRKKAATAAVTPATSAKSNPPPTPLGASLAMSPLLSPPLADVRARSSGAASAYSVNNGHMTTLMRRDRTYGGTRLVPRFPPDAELGEPPAAPLLTALDKAALADDLDCTPRIKLVTTNGRVFKQKEPKPQSKLGAKLRQWYNTANYYDRLSRVLFPLAFGVFNAIYWGTYFTV